MMRGRVSNVDFTLQSLNPFNPYSLTLFLQQKESESLDLLTIPFLDDVSLPFKGHCLLQCIVFLF